MIGLLFLFSPGVLTGNGHGVRITVTAIDGIFVGQSVGSDGIAAINIFAPMFMIFTGIGLMAGIGCSVVASIHLAKGKTKVARLNVTQAMAFVTLVALPHLSAKKSCLKI